MSRNFYDSVLSFDALNTAWRELLASTKRLSRNTVGIDDCSINDFSASHKDNIVRLYGSIAEKKFRFSQLRPTLIVKPSGKDRLICVPTVRDRIVQRALLGFLADRYHTKLANSISFGFVKGRSVKQAAELACVYRNKSPWVFKTDITSFFDTIDRKILSNVLTKIIRERSLHSILLSAIDCEVGQTNKSNQKRIAKLGIREGDGLRQGMPISPFFSNLLLYDFDRAVEKRKFRAVRYADDLVFFCESQAECEEVAHFCEHEFAKIGLEIPALHIVGTKSEIYDPSRGAEFLGLEMGLLEGQYELRLSSKQIDRLRNEILNYGSVKELLSRGITLKNFGSVLSAKINGYLAAYDVCKNLEQVQRDLKDVERKTLLKVYREDLKIDLKSLTSEARTFLSI